MSGYRRLTSYWWREKWYSVRYAHRSIWYHVILMRDYLPVVWRQADWDQTYIYELLLIKFKRMRRRAERHKVLASWDKQARDYTICENLLKRLLADGYYDYENYQSPVTPQDWAKFRRETKHEEYMRKQDIDYLFRLMARRIQIWWD